ncbi:MAG: hypothetical protein IPP72_18795 [Chitinophagaceae bacterium]|nr:hypothetical protein [Chitinophagaceae bacterium]
MASNNNKIEGILHCLDGAEKLQAPAFFYTRLKGRMEKEMLQEPQPFFLLRPVFLSICLLLVFAFNIITLINTKKDVTPMNSGTATIESFAKEYNMVSNELYQ